MNLPNSLTVTRIVLVPVLVTILLTEFPGREIWGLLVLVTAAITDFLDGYLARKRKQITTTGILLDPIADKLLISAAFISLVELGVAPAWMVVIVVGREFAVTGLRSVAATQGFTIPASRLGKYKMVAQVFCAGFLIGGRIIEGFFVPEIGQILLIAVVVLALVSMVQYFRRFASRVDAKQPKDSRENIKRTDDGPTNRKEARIPRETQRSTRTLVG